MTTVTAIANFHTPSIGLPSGGVDLEAIGTVFTDIVTPPIVVLGVEEAIGVAPVVGVLVQAIVGARHGVQVHIGVHNRHGGDKNYQQQHHKGATKPE